MFRTNRPHPISRRHRGAAVSTAGARRPRRPEPGSAVPLGGRRTATAGAASRHTLFPPHGNLFRLERPGTARASRDAIHLGAASDPKSGSGGFSLVELVFVLVILGVLTSMAAPLIGTGRYRSDTAVQEMAMTLNAAQRLAVLRQHDVVVTFDLSARTFLVLRDADNDGQRGTGEETRTRELPETVGYGSGTAPLLPGGSGPVTFAAGSGSGDPTLTFHRNGSASAGGVIYLRPVEGSMSASPEAVRALSVERSTGEIRCYSFRSGEWEASC